jgi:dipeptidyl-peptidase-4
LITEISRTWINLEKDFRPLRDGSFLWGSSRSGWRHLYLYARDGDLIRPVTSGDWRIADPWVTPDIQTVAGVDEAKGLVYFIASKDTPLEQQLYSVSYRVPGPPRQLTTGHGWWLASMAADRPTTFVGQYADPATPPQTGLYGLDGTRLAWIAENRLSANHPYFPYLDHRPTYEFSTIKAVDGQDLHTMLAKPPNFDPFKRYPVIVKVYGGPGVQLVRRDFRSFSDQIYTQAGYLVFALDNRGSANRSDAFEHAISGALGTVSSDDQIAGVAFLKTLPFVDPDRIGMTGWSFGAYETVRVMSTPGSGVRAGVAGGTPSEFHKYDTHYTERFLGKPQDQAAAYDAAALLPRAKNLNGELLLMHGMSDDNVSLSNFTALVLELEKAGKPFEVDVFPGQSHAIRGEAAQARQMKDALRFFDRALAPRRSLAASSAQ